MLIITFSINTTIRSNNIVFYSMLYINIQPQHNELQNVKSIF